MGGECGPADILLVIYTHLQEGSLNSIAVLQSGLGGAAIFSGVFLKKTSHG
jgi:hypothetical protein